VDGDSPRLRRTPAGARRIWLGTPREHSSVDRAGHPDRRPYRNETAGPDITQRPGAAPGGTRKAVVSRTGIAATGTSDPTDNGGEGSCRRSCGKVPFECDKQRSADVASQNLPRKRVDRGNRHPEVVGKGAGPMGPRHPVGWRFRRPARPSRSDQRKNRPAHPGHAALRHRGKTATPGGLPLETRRHRLKEVGGGGTRRSSIGTSRRVRMRIDRETARRSCRWPGIWHWRRHNGATAPDTRISPTQRPTGHDQDDHPRGGW